MDTSTQAETKSRKNFSRIPSTLAIPNLIEVQKRSYDRFLQMNLLPEERAIPVLRLPGDLLARFREVLDRRVAVQVR